MKRKIINQRKVKKILRNLISRFQELLAVPAVKPLLLLIISICILLIPVPYFITKISPENTTGNNHSQSRTSFERLDIPDKIAIYRTESGKVERLDFEDYVKGVVSGEMPSDFHIEALKAQAVAARTYSLSSMLKAQKSSNPKAHPSAPLCDSTHCQVYRSPAQLKTLKGKEWISSGGKKVSKAVDATKGELLYYKGTLVEQALFHSSSGGKTENSQDVFASAVPYLVSVDSPYEDNATHFNEKNSFSISKFSAKIKSSFPSINFGSISKSNIKIVSRSNGGRVEKVRIGKGIIEGRNVREALGLPSANFDINISDNTITFTSKGFGHGVGMSQYGAYGMAERGYDYKKILSHYYSGTKVY